jgi:hypothetical protein
MPPLFPLPSAKNSKPNSAASKPRFVFPQEDGLLGFRI